MATCSIFSSVNIKNKRDAKKLILALEGAKSLSESKDRTKKQSAAEPVRGEIVISLFRGGAE